VSAPNTAYDPEQWHDLFVMSGGAAAALAGLLFVAVSLNLEDVLAQRGLPPLAARSLQVLLGLLVLSILVLVPGQSSTTLGTQVTALGAVLLALAGRSVARSHWPVDRWTWTAGTTALALVSTMPVLLTGVSLLGGVGGGLQIAVVALIAGFAIALHYAWVLLIEILR